MVGWGVGYNTFCSLKKYKSHDLQVLEFTDLQKAFLNLKTDSYACLLIETGIFTESAQCSTTIC